MLKKCAQTPKIRKNEPKKNLDIYVLICFSIFPIFYPFAGLTRHHQRLGGGHQVDILPTGLLPELSKLLNTTLNLRETKLLESKRLRHGDNVSDTGNV